ncbi:MAG: hypothetical protein IPM18_03660 [Phycisphaerales bacterium]|nr:hypothetical protein [Phycisphaerales bacterium]
MHSVGRSIALIPLLLCTTACAPRYELRLTTYAAHDAKRTPATGPIQVTVATAPSEPLLEPEVRRKITILLTQQGHEVVQGRPGALVLAAFLGMGAERWVSTTRSVTEPGGYGSARYYDGRGRVRTITTYYPSRTFYVPYTYAVYPRVLTLTLFRTPTDPEISDNGHTNTGLPERVTSDDVLWRATVHYAGPDPDVRAVVDFLLIPALERFGTDTGREISVVLAEDDPRVTQLRAALTAP